MEIAAYQPESLIDYSGKISTLIFSPKCNYRCPACHAGRVLDSEVRISEKEFFDYLDSRKGWIDAVVIGGGEPTLDPDLINFARKIKERDLALKLDTNGSNYNVLSNLKETGLVDYVAMDVKAPGELYPVVVGKNNTNFSYVIGQAMKIISQFPDYEFRTTIAPVFRDGLISFMTPEEVKDIAQWIVEATGNHDHKYFLQTFVTRSREEMVDGRLSKENLPKDMHETPKDLLRNMCERAMKHLPNTQIR